MGGAVFLVAEVAVEVDVAGVEQGGRAVGEPGEFGVGRFEFTNAQPAVGVEGDLLGRQLGERPVAVDGAQQAVGVVVALVAEAGRDGGRPCGRSGCPRGRARRARRRAPSSPRPDAHAFVGAQAAGNCCQGDRGAPSAVCRSARRVPTGRPTPRPSVGGARSGMRANAGVSLVASRPERKPQSRS